MFSLNCLSSQVAASATDEVDLALTGTMGPVCIEGASCTAKTGDKSIAPCGIVGNCMALGSSTTACAITTALDLAKAAVCQCKCTTAVPGKA